MQYTIHRKRLRILPDAPVNPAHWQILKIRGTVDKSGCPSDFLICQSTFKLPHS